MKVQHCTKGLRSNEDSLPLRTPSFGPAVILPPRLGGAFFGETRFVDSPMLPATAAIRPFLFTVTPFEISRNRNCLQGFWVCGFTESNLCALPASIRERAEAKARSGFEVK